MLSRSVDPTQRRNLPMSRSTSSKRSILFRGIAIVGSFWSLLFLAPAGARGETIAWNNVAGGSWNTAANWAPQDVPNEAGEEAVFPAGQGTLTVSLNTSPSLDRVTLLNGTTTLNLGGQSLTLLLQEGLTN